MWPKFMAATTREEGGRRHPSTADARSVAARFETQRDGGASTPRGTNKRGVGSASTPRGSSASSAAPPAAGGGGLMGGGVWGEQLDPVKVEADLDHALLNAKHNRRAGQIYANYKRPAPKGDQYPQKRARRVRFNLEHGDPASSSHPPTTPRRSETHGRFSQDVSRAVAAARESASVAQSGVRGGERDAHPTSSGRTVPRHIEISSVPVPLNSPTVAGGPGQLKFDFQSLFGQAKGAMEHINFGQASHAPQQATRAPQPEPATSGGIFGQGALGGLGWNLWGTPIKDKKDSTAAAGKENQGVAGLRAASSEIPFSPTKVSGRQWQVNTSGTSPGPQGSSAPAKTVGRRISSDMQLRLERYQQAVAQSSPAAQVPAPATPEVPRPLTHRRDFKSPAYSKSSATPSKSHVAPVPPSQGNVTANELAESPTNSQPHHGPVFNRRPPTLGHTHAHTYKPLLTQVQSGQAKPAGYLGARGLYSQGGGGPSRDRDLELWRHQVQSAQPKPPGYMIVGLQVE